MSVSPRPAIQLHTLRGLDATVPETVQRVGALGFEGVEFAGTLETVDVGALNDALASAGVEGVAGHVGLETLQEEFEATLRRYDRVGCHRVVVPHLGPERFVTDRLVRATADELAGLGARLAERGFRLLYHNTPADMRPAYADSGVGELLSRGPLPEVAGDRATALLHRLVGSNPDRVRERTVLGQVYTRTIGRPLGFEIDVGSVAAGGYEPTAVLDAVGDRLELIHYTEGAPLEPTLRAARGNEVPWVIFENDHPEDTEATLHHAANVLVGALGDGGHSLRGRQSQAATGPESP